VVDVKAEAILQNQNKKIPCRSVISISSIHRPVTERLMKEGDKMKKIKSVILAVIMVLTLVASSIVTTINSDDLDKPCRINFFTLNKISLTSAMADSTRWEVDALVRTAGSPSSLRKVSL
jgi:hypothetical protein